LDVYKDTVFSERFAKRAFYPQDEKRTEIKAALLARAQDRVSRSDFDGAKQLVTRLLEMDEYQPQAHSLKGTIAHKEGRVEESIRHWERALELDPQQPRTREYLVEAYQKAGRPLPKNIAEDERLLQREPAFATSSPDPLKVKLRDP